MSDNYVLKLYNRITKLPFGHKLFSLFSARKAPYFTTINPLITHLEPGRCECLIKKTKKVHNHIQTVHVIAICNGLELAMGFMAESSIPKHLRWLPKGMNVEYTAMAGSDIRCEAVLPNNEWSLGNLPVTVTAYDKDDVVVVKGTINLWITEKKSSEAA